MKNRKKILATLLSAILIAGVLPVPTNAATNDQKITRIGNKERTVTAGNEFELSVKKLGIKKISDSQLKWTIKDTSVVGFDDDDRYDDEIELRAKKAGKTTITCNNLVTGGKISYVITVKSASADKNYKITRVGNKERSYTVGNEFELSVKKLGVTKIKDSQLNWTIKDTSIVGFDDDDRYDNEIELRAKKAGTTKVYCHNLVTGGKVTYTITVKGLGTNKISRVGAKTKTVRLGDDIELSVNKGKSLYEHQIQWSIANTSLLKFDDGENYGDDVEVIARKTGTTTVTANNLATGGKIVYTINIIP